MANRNTVNLLVQAGLNINIIDPMMLPHQNEIARVYQSVADFVILDTGAGRISRQELSNLIQNVLFYLCNFGTSGERPKPFTRRPVVNGNAYNIDISYLITLITGMTQSQFVAYHANDIYNNAVLAGHSFLLGRVYGVVEPGVGFYEFVYSDNYATSNQHRRLWRDQFLPKYMNNGDSPMWEILDLDKDEMLKMGFDFYNL